MWERRAALKVSVPGAGSQWAIWRAGVEATGPRLKTFSGRKAYLENRLVLRKCSVRVRFACRENGSTGHFEST